MFKNGCYTKILARACLWEFFVERTWIESWKILVLYNCTQLWAKLVTWQVVSGRGVVVGPRIYHSQLATWWVVAKAVYNYLGLFALIKMPCVAVDFRIAYKF